MTCIRCGETKTERALHTFRRTVDGCAFVSNAEVDACARCRDVQVPLALLLAFERAVAADLARGGPVSGDTFRFIRKAVPLQPIEVARLLAVPLEMVSRWEAGRRAMDFAPWLVVATIALEKFDAPVRVLPWIQALRGPVRTERMVDIHRGGGRTVRELLDLLSGPVALTDEDIADALGVSAGGVRARLDELAGFGLVDKREVHPSGAIRWEPRERALAVLEQRAREHGVDVDAPLPPPDAPCAPGPVSVRVDRLVPVTWRASI